jgi:hypothetical protein
VPLVADLGGVFARQGAVRDCRQVFRLSQTANRPSGGATHERAIVACQGDQRREMRRVRRVAGRDDRIAHDPVAACAFDRRTGEPLAERGVVKCQQLGNGRVVGLRPRVIFLFARPAGELVPRADGETVVAAKHPVSHRRTQRAAGSAP